MRTPPSNQNHYAKKVICTTCNQGIIGKTSRMGEEERGGEFFGAQAGFWSLSSSFFKKANMNIY